MTDDNLLLYIKIFEEFRNRILRGELKTGDKLPSENQLAEMYGVSLITVKRSLDKLSQENLIKKVKGSGSFVTFGDSSKPELTRSQSNVIGLSLAFGDQLGGSMELISGAGDYLQSRGYHLSVRISDFNPAKEREIITNFFNMGVAGIISYPFSDTKNLDIYYKLFLEKCPIITVDRYFADLPIKSVISDNFAGAYDAVNFLIQAGHRNIGYLSSFGLDAASTVRSRYFGYCKAIKDSGIEFKENNAVIDYLSEENGSHREGIDLFNRSKQLSAETLDFTKRIVGRLVDRPDKVTAIHTLNDYDALILMKTASEMGIRVPQDLSVIGFDNILISGQADIPLTTVSQDFYKMGFEAAKQLVGDIGRNETDATRSPDELKILLPTKIIERSSVCNLA